MRGEIDYFTRGEIITKTTQATEVILHSLIFYTFISSIYLDIYYRSGTVNSKSFVGKVLLRIKWKFELINAL